VNDGTTRHWRYVPALDGVRAVAVALVVLAHSYEMLLWRQSSLLARNWSPVPGGAFGVDMFFALSGFLITALLFTEFQQTGRIDFRAFYIRRALRLLPALVAVLVATSIYAAVTGYAAHRQLQSVFGSFFYFANWMQILHIPMSPLLLHTWSLSVEEQFYIVWPAIVAWWWLRGGRALTWLVGAFLCVSFAYRFHVLFGGQPYLLLYISTLARADSLLIGALGAYLWATRAAPRRVGWLGWSGVAIVIWLVGHHGDMKMLQLIGWTAMGVATTMLILAILNDWRGATVLAWKPIRAVGRVSYGIYLWHVPVFVFVQIRGDALPPLTRLVIAWAATAVVVVFSWFCIERPFLALKPRPRAKAARQPAGEVRPAAVPAVEPASTASAGLLPSQDPVGNGRTDPGDHFVEHL